MVQILNIINPDATKYWSDRIAQVGQERLNTIFDSFPSNSSSPERIEFAKVFIDYNSLRLQQTISNSELVLLEPSELESPVLDDSPELPDDPSEPPRRNRPKPPTPPNSPDSLNSPELPRPQMPNEIDPLQEPNQSSGTSVTSKQIIDLKNYYVKSPDGQAKLESINASEKFNLHKYH